MEGLDFTEAFKHTHETINVENLEALSKDRRLKGYWGTAPTGKPHVAYLFPILSISRMIKQGIDMTILIADYHATLDNNKTEWEQLHAKTEYYILVIKELLRLTGVDPDGAAVKFVKGTDHQRGNPAYLDDLLKLSSKITVSIAKRATAEVVKCGSNPPLSNCIYPLMQVLDEVYLDTDFEFGGVDQRKIFMFGIDYLPRIGYGGARSYVMNPMIHSLGKSGKMSASDEKTKIDLMDDRETIMKKCRKAWCVDGEVADNGVLDMYKYIIFPMSKSITVTRPEKYGGDVFFADYEALHQMFDAKEISSCDIKETLGRELANILEPLQDRLRDVKVIQEAYGMQGCSPERSI